MNLSRDFREPVSNCLKSVNLCRLGSKPFSKEVKSVQSCFQRKLIFIETAMADSEKEDLYRFHRAIEEKSEGEIQCIK